MAPKARRLVVNADDFGRSESINHAVVSAHHEGILTTASLMVNEPACAEAVRLAREHPRLGVGLHLTLLCGRSALEPARIPDLVDAEGNFTNSSFRAGWRYFFQRSIRDQLRAEIRAQFARFRATGLPLDHVNGHLHLHLHPVVLDLLLAEAAGFGLTRLRLTRDPFLLNLRLASGRLLYRGVHALVFQVLAARARARFRRHGIRHTEFVFGLLQNALVDEAYVLRLLPELPPGDSELYSHPSLDEFRPEYEALISPRVRSGIERLGLELICYRDL